MSYVVKEPKGTYILAPAGLHQAVCVDVVDKGMMDSPWGAKPKVMLRWQIDERIEDEASDYYGERFIVNKLYTASLHEKANLRADLESWRGRAFTEEELEGFDLDVLIGVNCQVNVVHVQKGEKTYANVKSIVPPGKGSVSMRPEKYQRIRDREGYSPPSSNLYAEEPPPPEDDDIPFLLWLPLVLPLLGSSLI